MFIIKTLTFAFLTLIGLILGLILFPFVFPFILIWSIKQHRALDTAAHNSGESS
jgi:hypothetical protein